MEGNIAVIGDTDFVKPFSALGVDTYPITDAAGNVTENARKIIDRKYTLVIVAENIARIVEEVFSGCQNMPTPCIVVVPFTTEPQGFATEALAKVLKMATGINISNE